MQSNYPQKIQEENDRLMNLYLNSPDADPDIDAFVQQNASPEFIKYMDDAKRRSKELRAQGIIEN